MKGNALRITVFVVILVVGIGLIEMKKTTISAKRSEKVESPLSLFIEKGAPVHVLTVAPQTLRLYKTAIVEPCSKTQYCTFVSRHERKTFKVWQSVVKAESGEVLGQVRSVSKRSDISNGLFKVTIHAKGFLEKGQRLSSRIVTGFFKDMMAVPQSALQQEGDDYFLWQVTKDEQGAVKVPVKIGMRGLTNVQITEGIEMGAKIISRGADQYQKYKKLRVIKKTNSGEPSPSI